MNSKIFSFLEYQKMEILEDILLFSPFTASILFYIEKNDGFHYCDYEVATTEEPTIDIYPDNLDFEVYDNYQKAEDEAKLIPGFTNIIYDDESYKIIPLKDLLKIVLKMQNPSFSNDSIIIQSYLLINSMSAYKLSQLIGITKQALSRFIIGHRPFPDKVKKDIAEVLKIDLEEFSQEIETFLFDETDL